ncbi:MAG: energy transducer TonB [Acidobacteria bacterium]|nr:energy transducer TonB [Acidobacteriota bacterium]
MAAQESNKKTGTIYPGDLKEHLLEGEFSEVPDDVRRYHARGQLVFRITDDEQGNVVKINHVSGFKSSKILSEYVTETVAKWKFKPRIVDREPREFSTNLVVYFWYGSFPIKRPEKD